MQRTNSWPANTASNPDPQYPYYTHSFASVNDYWFDVPRDPPLIILRDAVSRRSGFAGSRSSFLEGHVNCHQDFLAIFIVQHGRARHIIEGRPYEVARGDVFVMGLGAWHQYLQCDELEVDALYFTPQLLDASATEILGKQPAMKPILRPDADGNPGGAGGGEHWKHLSPASLDEINAELAELKQEWATATDTSRLLTRLLLCRLLVHLSRTANAFASAEAERGPSSPLSTPDVVAAALQIIEHQFTEQIRIEEIACSLYVSADWLTRLFVHTTGRTPRDYIRYLRIERAKGLLMASMDSITEIAGKSGFGNSSYFALAFRQATGVSPRKYREKFSA